MRLRRLCLEIFALRLFLREPIQVFGFASRIQPSNALLCNLVFASFVLAPHRNTWRCGAAGLEFWVRLDGSLGRAPDGTQLPRAMCKENIVSNPISKSQPPTVM